MVKSAPNCHGTGLKTRQRYGKVYKTNREYKIWARSISEKTLETYDYSLDQFFSYTKKVKDLTSLLKMKSDQLQELLEDYTMYLTDRGITRNTVKLYLSSLESILVFHDIPYKKKKLHRLFPARAKPAGSQGYTLEDMQAIAKGCITPRSKAMVLMIASSGMRRGGYADLKVGDLMPIEDSYIIKVYADTDKEYVTFCTPEARKATEEYFEYRKEQGEQFTKDSPVFKTTGKGEVSSNRARLVSCAINDVIKKIKMDKELANGSKDKRYTKATVHGMRKFCNTMLNKAKLQHNDIEKIMGHSNGLKGLYYTPESNDLYNEYEKAIPLLTISREYRQEVTIQNLKKRSVENEVAISEQITDMQQTIEMLERKIILYEEDLIKHSS